MELWQYDSLLQSFTLADGKMNNASSLTLKRFATGDMTYHAIEECQLELYNARNNADRE